MEEPLLKPILETIRERADCALKEIERMEEPKAVKWRCSKCGHLKHFTRPVTVVGRDAMEWKDFRLRRARRDVPGPATPL